MIAQALDMDINPLLLFSNTIRMENGKLSQMSWPSVDTIMWQYLSLLVDECEQDKQCSVCLDTIRLQITLDPRSELQSDSCKKYMSFSQERS